MASIPFISSPWQKAAKLKRRSASSREFVPGKLDSGLVTGFLLSLVLVAGGMALTGSVENFFSISGLAIVVGGTVGATLIQFSISDMFAMTRSLSSAIERTEDNVNTRMRELLKLSKIAKNDGMMVLEHESHRSTDPFYKLALQLVVDGHNPLEIRHILSTEIASSNRQSERSVRILDTMGGYAPALGLIGTLIGLIQMLTALQNPAAVGPAMAVALVTTFYGAILANLVFLPLAGKLRIRAEEESYLKNITLEGVVSIAKQENAVVLEQRMVGMVGAYMRRG